MDMGQVITELRLEKGVYQKELASVLKVSVGTISNYEKGRHFPDPSTMCKIADFFGVTTDYLLGRTNYRYDPKQLSQPFIDNYTIADLVNTSLDLTPQNKHALADYVELLKLRQKADSSGR